VPTITDIRTAKRRSGWMEIELDGASVIQLPDDRLLALGLSRGDDMEPSAVDALLVQAERAEAMRIALGYLSVRPRSRQEVSIRLRQKGIGALAGDAALERCDELGYLDDVAFAAAFARDRMRLKPCGVRRMKSDLRGKGVLEADALAGIAEAFRDERTTEDELLERAARRRARSLKNRDPEVVRRRLFAFLTRRGFGGVEVRAWLDRNTESWNR
jgi:regulatory protein